MARFSSIDTLLDFYAIAPIEMLLAGPIAEVKVIKRFPSRPQKQTMSVSSATEVEERRMSHPSLPNILHHPF